MCGVVRILLFLRCGSWYSWAYLVDEQHSPRLSLVHPWFILGSLVGPKCPLSTCSAGNRSLCSAGNTSSSRQRPPTSPPHVCGIRSQLIHLIHMIHRPVAAQLAACDRTTAGPPSPLSPLPLPQHHHPHRAAAPQNRKGLHASSALGKACHIRIVASSAPVAYVAPPDAERFAKTNVSAARSVCGEGCS